MRVLIAGATSAVAQAMIAQYAATGAKIVCLARNQEKLEQQLSRIGVKAEKSLYLDFNDLAAVSAAINFVFDELGTIDVAVIAHGVLPDQIATENNMQRVHEVFHDNCLSAIGLIQAVSPRMLEQGFGKVAVITSVAGDRGRPRNFTYGAAKSALSVYVQGLRSVLWQSGVELYTFKLGPVDTPMTRDHDKNFSFTTAHKAGSLMIKALNKKRYVVYVPGFWRFVMCCVRNMPEAIFQRLAFLSAR